MPRPLRRTSVRDTVSSFIRTTTSQGQPTFLISSMSLVVRTCKTLAATSRPLYRPFHTSENPPLGSGPLPGYQKEESRVILEVGPCDHKYCIKSVGTSRGLVVRGHPTPNRQGVEVEAGVNSPVPRGQKVQVFTSSIASITFWASSLKRLPTIST
jgi:hypothetical protein